MRSGLLGLIATGAVLLALAVSTQGAEDETAGPRDASGVSTVWRAGKTTNVDATTKFSEGDIIRVAEGSRLTVAFEDDASIALVGPAALRFGPMTRIGRRVVLGSGAASEVVVNRIALEIQAPNPYDASLVLQNARGFARVSPGDRIVFQRTEGSFTKVWYENHYTELGAEPWVLNIRDGHVVTQREQIVGDDTVRMVVGGVEITIHPASQFSRSWSDDGALALAYKGSGDSFGEVEVGDETSMYVFEGQGVGFDSNGDVTQFQGVSHLYRPLFERVPQDDPVENAANASPSLSRRR